MEITAATYKLLHALSTIMIPRRNIMKHKDRGCTFGAAAMNLLYEFRISRAF